MSTVGRILSIDALEDTPGVAITDRVERHRYELHTEREVSPGPAPSDGFLFPVDSAVTLTVQQLVVPTVVGVLVRDDSGGMITEVDHLESTSLEEGSYLLELSAQIKTYMEVTGPVEVSSGVEETKIDFGRPTEIRVGACSWHDRPAATVTTPGDPVGMMSAISTFGSALKTTSPERSFPSNRGHPPAVKLGDELAVPDCVQPPETGIRLELPATYEAVYASAPLAYYLGAEVVLGQSPRLITDTGYEHPLDGAGGVGREIERVLKQVFLLDCLTRTEGVYEIPLHERAEIESSLELDFATLYDRPLAEQVATYLAVPYSRLEAHVPEWRLTVHVDPTEAAVEQLPFVVDDLAIVRTADAAASTAPAGTDATAESARTDALTRSATDGAQVGGSYVEPESTDSLEQAWIGEQIPVGASKLTSDAFQNRLDREASDGDISIRIVLNDPRMAEERDLVDGVYGDRENLRFDVTVRRELTVEELRETLQQDYEFLHYIGHTDSGGFECVDGKLDASTLPGVGVDSFLLNACNSYEQGLALIEAGAIGGIVTLADIINDGAVRMGESIARLLNAGFPLRAALTIARDESILGGQYIVVGDGGMTVAQAAGRTPYLLELSPTADRFELEFAAYTTDDAGLGSVFMPHLSGNDEYFLNSGTSGRFHVTEDELDSFCQLEDVPVLIDDELHWSHSLDIDDLM